MAAVPQERALQGRMSVAFGICKNALRMERQARQSVTAKPAMIPGNATHVLLLSTMFGIALTTINSDGSCNNQCFIYYFIMMAVHQLWS